MKNKNNRRAYISCPIAVPMEDLLKVEKLLKDKGYDPFYWKRGTKYDNNIFDDAELFVLMTSNNLFELSVDDLPSGCRRETILAEEQCMPVFLAYTSRVGLNIYKTDIDEWYLTGIQGQYLPSLEAPVLEHYLIY